MLLSVELGTCYHLRLTNIICTSKLRLNWSSEIRLNFIYLIRERKIHGKNTCLSLIVVFLGRNSVTSVSTDTVRVSPDTEQQHSEKHHHMLI